VKRINLYVGLGIDEDDIKMERDVNWTEVAQSKLLWTGQ
jgi:hypothetical protein